MFDDVMLDMDLAIESIGEEYDASDEVNFGDEIDFDESYGDTDSETSLEDEEEMMESMLFFGLEWDPATESIRDFLEDSGKRIAKKLKKLAVKIKLFVQKCVNWVRSKLYRLLKVDTITINANEYNAAMGMIKMLNQSKTWADKGLNRVKVMLTMSKAKTLGRMEERGKSIAEKSVSDKFLSDGEKLADLIDSKIKNADDIYLRMVSSGRAKASRTVTVRSAGIANQKTYMKDSLDKLISVSEALAAASVKAEKDGGEQAKLYSVVSKLITCAVNITKKRISLLNTIIVKGTRGGKKKTDTTTNLDETEARNNNYDMKEDE